MLFRYSSTAINLPPDMCEVELAQLSVLSHVQLYTPVPEFAQVHEPNSVKQIQSFNRNHSVSKVTASVNKSIKSQSVN